MKPEERPFGASLFMRGRLQCNNLGHDTNHDSMWSLNLARPWGLSQQNITISIPQRDLDELRNMRWTPYGNGSGGLQLDPPVDIEDPVETYGEALVALCEQMRDINRALYDNFYSIYRHALT